MAPKVSVIMAVLNGERLIDHAIASIVDRGTVMNLCEELFALSPPRSLRLRGATRSSTLRSLASGKFHFAIGRPPG